MSEGVRIQVLKLSGDEVLAGAVQGTNLLATCISELAEHDEAGPVFVDFEGIQVATWSFLRECVLGLRSYLRSNRHDRQVVVANAAPVILEELALHLSADGDALVACTLADGGAPRNARVVGRLDEKQGITFRAVLELGTADASTLSKRERISQTGWNNRLTALVAKGLLVEIREGRSKKYRPILKDIQYGN